MMNNKSNNSTKAGERKPNEHAGFSFSSSIKITDPNTKQVLLHKRGDI